MLAVSDSQINQTALCHDAMLLKTTTVNGQCNNLAMVVSESRLAVLQWRKSLGQGSRGR